MGNLVDDLLKTYSLLRKRQYKITFLEEDRRSDLQDLKGQSVGKPAKIINQNDGSAKDQSNPGDVVQFDNSQNVTDNGTAQKYVIGPEGEQIPINGTDELSGDTTGSTQTDDPLLRFETRARKWDSLLTNEHTEGCVLDKFYNFVNKIDAPLDLSCATQIITDYCLKNFPTDWETFKNNKHLDLFGRILVDLALGFIGQAFTVELDEAQINQIMLTLIRERKFIFDFESYKGDDVGFMNQFVAQPLEGGRVRIFFKNEEEMHDAIEVRSDFVMRGPEHEEILPSYIPLSGQDSTYFDTSSHVSFYEDLNKIFQSVTNNVHMFACGTLSRDTFINNFEELRDRVDEFVAIYATVLGLEKGQDFKLYDKYSSQVREWCDRVFELSKSLNDNEYLNTDGIFNLGAAYDYIWDVFHKISISCAKGYSYICSNSNPDDYDVDYYFLLGGKTLLKLPSIILSNSKLDVLNNLLLIDNEEQRIDYATKLLEKFSNISPEKIYHITHNCDTKTIIGYIRRCLLHNTGSSYREPYIVSIVKEYLNSNFGARGSQKNLVIYADLHPFYEADPYIFDKSVLANDLKSGLTNSSVKIKPTKNGCGIYKNNSLYLKFNYTSEGNLDMHILPHVLRKYSTSVAMNPYILPGFTQTNNNLAH